jgi:hypothetical protein
VSIREGVLRRPALADKVRGGEGAIVVDLKTGACRTGSVAFCPKFRLFIEFATWAVPNDVESVVEASSFRDISDVSGRRVVIAPQHGWDVIGYMLCR